MEKQSGKIAKSYVISVSIETGCYRHIRIDSACTLEDLSSAILWAFDFADDHAHAFFMDNKGWSDADCYYAKFVDEDERHRHTSDYKLADLKVGEYKKIAALRGFPNNSFKVGEKPLDVGDKFLYIFDFGDDWHFACKVLKVLDESTEETMIVRTKGEAPSQYDWECEDADEE